MGAPATWLPSCHLLQCLPFFLLICKFFLLNSLTLSSPLGISSHFTDLVLTFSLPQ